MHISPSRTGKIARLSASLREELNRRLHNGESGPKLTAWLNSLSEVQGLLKESFESRPVSEQNLSEWRNGGYRDWLAERTAADQSTNVAAQAAALAKTGITTDSLFTHLVALYAVAISHWDGVEGSPSHARLLALKPLSKEVLALRRSEQNALRLALGRDKLEFSKSAVRKESSFAQSPDSSRPSSSESPSAISSSAPPSEVPNETPYADSVAAAISKRPKATSVPTTIFKSTPQASARRSNPLDGPILATR